MALGEQEVRQALKSVRDPETGRELVVRHVEIEGTRVALQVELAKSSPLQDKLRSEVAAALSNTDATEFALHVTEPAGAASTAAGGGGGSGGGPLSQVKHVIAVGAGKGGVGKSTLALNLAVGLQRMGLKVGVMDGDVYGPSMPTMLGIKGQTPSLDGGNLVPFHVHGIHAVTIGAIVEPDKALIWRGPMAQAAFKQLMVDNTRWPELDFLIVDLPPGTGDVPLTLCQMLPLTGAVVVATPQQVALDDAVRAVRMFQQLNAPVLGMIENMSYLPVAGGGRVDLFGTGNAEKEAGRLRIPFLGALPLYPELRVNSDMGRPHANFDGGNKDLAGALEVIVSNLLAQVKLREAFPRGPELSIT